MLQIQCPWCGQSDEIEFAFGGQSHLSRPDPQQCSDQQWADYLFNRDNPKGKHCERWAHRYGCGRWFNLVRDTVSHEILGVYKIGESAP